MLATTENDTHYPFIHPAAFTMNIVGRSKKLVGVVGVGMGVVCREGLCSSTQFEQDAGDAGDHSEESDRALIDLGAHDNFRHVGSCEGRDEVSHQVDELYGDGSTFLVDLVQSFQELHRGHLLQLLFEIGLFSEAMAKDNGHGDELPDDA